MGFLYANGDAAIHAILLRLHHRVSAEFWFNSKIPLSLEDGQVEMHLSEMNQES